MLLSAPFIAAIQVIVYAGAILVLFLFVLMLLNVPQEEHRGDSRPIQRVVSGVAILFFAGMLPALLRSHGMPDLPLPPAAERSVSGIRSLARLLFSEYLLAFEALSILLLAALVGAFVLARREAKT